MRVKQFRSSFSETFETFQDSSFSNLEGLDELRDKCEGGIADFKSMWDNLYKNKVEAFPMLSTLYNVMSV